MIKRLLLAPLRGAMRAAYISRKPQATPSGSGLLLAWITLALYPGKQQNVDLSIPLGRGKRLYGRNWAELDFLFEEIFLSDEYLADLSSVAPTILDCGANTGCATLYLKLRFPAARITAFEPNPGCVRVLERNVAANRLTDVSIVPAGCGMAPGTATLNFDRQFSMSGSFDPTRGKFSETVEVRVVKLSDYVTGTVDLLKLDVEGAEWDVFADLIQSNKLRLIDRMVIEYHHRAGGQRSRLGEFLSMLEAQGFEYSVRAPLGNDKRFSGTFQDIMLYAVRRSP